MKAQESQPTSRRLFLRRATQTAVVGALTLPLARSAHAAGSDILRVGLVGCGGRGTGAATQALSAEKQARLVAIGDAFADRAASCLKVLADQPSIAAQLDVPAERQFAGFGAIDDVLACELDVVLLATPPHFRPAHLRKAIKAGVHVFAEKPVAVDAPGVRHVLESAAMAKQKGLSVVSGLCLRYSNPFRETIARLQDGAIGEITTLEANDYRGPIWVRPRETGWSDMEYQMRNWYYFAWLSGDFNVEQHVHFLDVCAWLMGDTYPVRAVGMGGRQVRTGPDFGNIFDHHSVTYEYASGVKLYSNTRQMPGCHGDMSASACGEMGRAKISEARMKIDALDAPRWTYRGPENDCYQTEHDELFAGIRAGKPLNNGDYMARSTLMAIMGRMATYTGQEVTWDQAMNSQEDISPPRYEWGALEVASVPVPGVTQLR